MPASVCWLLCYADRTICNSSYWIWSENQCRWGMAVFSFLLLIQVSSLAHCCLSVCVCTSEKRTECKAKQIDTKPKAGSRGTISSNTCVQHKARIYQYDVILAPRNTDLSLYCKKTYPLKLVLSHLSFQVNLLVLAISVFCYDPSHVSLLPVPCLSSLSWSFYVISPYWELGNAGISPFFPFFCSWTFLVSFAHYLPFNLHLFSIPCTSFSLSYSSADLFCNIYLCLSLIPEASEVIPKMPWCCTCKCILWTEDK